MFHHYSVRPFVTLCRRALCGCLLLLLTVPAAMGDTQLPAAAYPQRHGDLTPREQAMAVKAWQYFVTNYQPATGLVNAVNNYPSTHLLHSPAAGVYGRQECAGQQADVVCDHPSHLRAVRFRDGLSGQGHPFQALTTRYHTRSPASGASFLSILRLFLRHHVFHLAHLMIILL